MSHPRIFSSHVNDKQKERNDKGLPFCRLLKSISISLLVVHENEKENHPKSRHFQKDLQIIHESRQLPDTLCHPIKEWTLRYSVLYNVFNRTEESVFACNCCQTFFWHFLNLYYLWFERKEKNKLMYVLLLFRVIQTY